jgi:hypothetical protein
VEKIIAITAKIDSEFLKIPELIDFFGKEVIITISENFKKNKLENFFEAAGKIDIEINEIF